MQVTDLLPHSFYLSATNLFENYIILFKAQPFENI